MVDYLDITQPHWVKATHVWVGPFLTKHWIPKNNPIWVIFNPAVLSVQRYPVLQSENLIIMVKVTPDVLILSAAGFKLISWLLKEITRD